MKILRPRAERRADLVVRRVRGDAEQRVEVALTDDSLARARWHDTILRTSGVSELLAPVAYAPFVQSPSAPRHPAPGPLVAR